MPTLFLDLPPELVIRILCYLDLYDLSACQLTHSSLRAVIKDSILIEYHIATQLAGVEDNPLSKLSIQERLERLASQEDGWAHLDFDFTKKISVEHNPSGIYDLTGGIYLLGDQRRRALHYCTLPSKSSDQTRWSRIDVEENIIDMGLAIYEHDLVAIVTITPQGETSDMHNIEILLLNFSTGEPHPQARLSRLFVEESRGYRPAIGIEIVGDNLALITTHYDNPFDPDDDLYVFDWKTGVLKLQATASRNSYAGLLFLSPSIILVPNGNNEMLEYWAIPPSATTTPANPIGALALPTLSQGYIIAGIQCRCEPNPVASGTPYSTQTFHSSPLDAIAIFNIRIQVIGGPPLSTSFSMFVHRRSLLSLRPKERPISSDGEYEYQIIPWEEWGPPVTRWLNADVLSSRWITTTAGERSAVMVENAGAVVILDFNPARVRRLEAKLMRGEVSMKKTELHTWVETRRTGIVHSCFEEHVMSRLPYASRMLAKTQSYEGILMDEERLIGLQSPGDFGATISEIEILHLGSSQPKSVNDLD